MRREDSLLREIWGALKDPPDWVGLIALIVWSVAALILAFSVYFGAASSAMILTLIVAAMLLPWLIYYTLLFITLAVACLLGAVLQLIAWAGRAWRGEPIF
jgi:uncharacterized membrane protein